MMGLIRTSDPLGSVVLSIARMGSSERRNQISVNVHRNVTGVMSSFPGESWRALRCSGLEMHWQELRDPVRLRHGLAGKRCVELVSPVV